MKNLIALVITLIVLDSFVFSQSIQIKDIQYRKGYQFNSISSEAFTFIYQIKTRNSQRVAFRKIDFDSHLRVMDTTLVEFIGDYTLIQSASSTNYTASLFGSRINSSLMIHFVNNDTENQISFPLKVMGPWHKKAVRIVSSDDNTFFVLYQFNSKVWELQEIDTKGNVLWRKMISDMKYKVSIGQITLLDRDHLALSISKNHKSRKIKNEVLIIDAHDGDDIYREQLFNDNSKSTFDNSFLTDSIFYSTGRTFFKNRISNQSTGLPYLKEFNSNSSNEIKLTSSLLNMKTFWMDLVKTDSGNRYLIGETFTNESHGAYILKGVVTGVMTMGLFYISWTSMKFNDIAIISLDDPDQPTFSLVKLKPRRIQLGNYAPGYTFAKYSYSTGQIRYWGHDSLGNLVLLDGNILKKYNLQSRKIEELGILPTGASQNVIYTSNDYVIYLNTRKINNLVEFKIVPLKK
jgi:hypothetical protein